MFPVDAFQNGRVLSLGYTVFCLLSKGNPLSSKAKKKKILLMDKEKHIKTVLKGH
jgi:hypothetical protein